MPLRISLLVRRPKRRVRPLTLEAPPVQLHPRLVSGRANSAGVHSRVWIFAIERGVDQTRRCRRARHRSSRVAGLRRSQIALCSRMKRVWNIASPTHQLPPAGIQLTRHGPDVVGRVVREEVGGQPDVPAGPGSQRVGEISACSRTPAMRPPVALRVPVGGRFVTRLDTRAADRHARGTGRRPQAPPSTDRPDRSCRDSSSRAPRTGPTPAVSRLSDARGSKEVRSTPTARC